MLKTIYRHFLPEKRLILKEPTTLEELVPAAQHYTLEEGEAVAYVCQAMTCHPGITDSRELAAKLEEVEGAKKIGGGG